LNQTLDSNPGKFFFYNNGITIVVSDFAELGENMIELHAPQIVNGAQTSNSILDHSKRTKNMEGSMTVTIIKADDEQEQNNITKYRNSQNSVRGKDLVSLMDFHKSIKSQLKNCGMKFKQVLLTQKQNQNNVNMTEMQYTIIIFQTIIRKS
jgi:hypothetical protein